MNEYEGIDAYRAYLAVKRHFTTDSYDYFKYSGKVSVKNETYLKRKDKFHFARLQKRYNKEELPYFFAANFLVNPNAWVGELLSEKSMQVWADFQKRQQSLMYILQQELSELKTACDMQEVKFVSIFKPKGENDFPVIFNALQQQMICLETFIIVDNILEFTSKWECLEGNFIWDEAKKKINKYRGFITFDQEKAKKVLRDIFYN